MISIVVPVFNCADYLDQCVRSLLTQNWDDLEILLINDGSTDRSGSICDHFSALDSRVRVVHRKNGGVSSARNLGMDMARGDLLMFVDADDYVEPEFVGSMAHNMKHHDIVTCAYDRVRSISQPFVLGKSCEISMADLYEHTLCTLMIGGGCCNKIFRMDIVRELSLRFDTRIAVGEDLLLLVQYLKRCRSAYYIGEILYHYRYNEASATEAGFTSQKLSQGSISVLTAMDEMERHIDRGVRYQADAMDYRKSRSSLRLFFQMVLARSPEPAVLKAIQKHIRQSLFTFLKSRHSKTLERVVAAAIAVSATPTYVLARAAAPLLKERLGAYRT